MRPHRRQVLRRRHLNVEGAQTVQRGGIVAGDVNVFVPGHPERHGDRSCRVLDLWQRLRRVAQPVPQRGSLRVTQFFFALLDTDPHERVYVIPQRERTHVVEAAHEQARAHEQHHRERALHHEQEDPRPRAMVRAFARARLERRGEIAASRLQRRRETRDQADEQHSGAGEHQRPAVAGHGNAFAGRQELRTQQRAPKLRDDQSDAAAKNGQNQALGE